MPALVLLAVFSVLPHLSGAALASTSSGEALFKANCAICHQLEGEGLGAYPPLRGNADVTGSNVKALITTLLNGRTGPIAVRGTTYDTAMPAAQLSNAEIAAVLTYIRMAWTNKASDVTEQEVIAAGPSVAWKAGLQIYGTRCISCHKVNGQGVSGTYPALAGNAHVNANDPKTLIVVLKRGHNTMPSWALLTDAETAAVLTYIRSAWGNNAKPVGPHDVITTIY